MKLKILPILTLLFIFLLPQIPTEAINEPIASVSYKQATPIEKGKKEKVIASQKKVNKQKLKKSKKIQQEKSKTWVPPFMAIIGSVLLGLAVLWGYYFIAILIPGISWGCGAALILGFMVYFFGILLLILLALGAIALIFFSFYLKYRFKRREKLWEDKPEGRNSYETELDKKADENFPLLPPEIRRSYVNTQLAIEELEKKLNIEKAKSDAKYPNSNEESTEVLILRQRIRELNERINLIEDLYENITDIHSQKRPQFFDLKLRLLKLEQEQTQLLGKKDRRSLDKKADIEQKIETAKSQLKELLKEE